MLFTRGVPTSEGVGRVHADGRGYTKCFPHGCGVWAGMRAVVATVLEFSPRVWGVGRGHRPQYGLPI